MRQLRILNTRQVKEILQKIEQQYGCEIKTELAFLEDDKYKIYLVNRDVAGIEFEKLRINSMGLYFAEISKGGEIRLTIEGSAIVGPLAKKNVVELSEEQLRLYFLGKDVPAELDIEGQPFVLLKYKTDFLGSVKYKEGKLLNYLPKVHRSEEVIL